MEQLKYEQLELLTKYYFLQQLSENPLTDGEFSEAEAQLNSKKTEKNQAKNELGQLKNDMTSKLSKYYDIQQRLQQRENDNQDYLSQNGNSKNDENDNQLINLDPSSSMYYGHSTEDLLQMDSTEKCTQILDKQIQVLQDLNQKAADIQDMTTEKEWTLSHHQQQLLSLESQIKNTEKENSSHKHQIEELLEMQEWYEAAMTLIQKFSDISIRVDNVDNYLKIIFKKIVILCFYNINCEICDIKIENLNNIEITNIDEIIQHTIKIQDLSFLIKELSK